MAYVFSARHDHGTGMPKAKPVVFVIGASGNIGKATVNSLSLTYGRKFIIKAGVRKPEKVTAFNKLVGVTVVKAEMGQREQLQKAFQGVDVLYIVCPGAENRAELSIVTAEAALEAGVKHLLVLSVATAELTDTTFGKQFHEIETAISNLGVPYTFLRLPLFIENYFAFQASIKDQLVFHGPVDPVMPYTSVAVDDAGSAAAAILSSPETHAGKTYTIVSDRHSFEDVAETFTKGLSRQVRYVRVPYEDAKAGFMQMGVQEWQAEGIMELYRLIDAGSPVTNQENLNDFSEITSKKPTPLRSWVMRVASGFK